MSSLDNAFMPPENRADAIEQIFLDDVVRLHWDVLRYNRLKTTALRRTSLDALASFIEDQIPQGKNDNKNDNRVPKEMIDRLATVPF